MTATSTQISRPVRVRARKVRHEAARRRSQGRRLVLIDIENISGGGIRTLAEAEWAHRMLSAAIGFGDQGQVIIGVSKAGAVNTWPIWSSARHVLGSGIDGADHALLEVLRGENIADRFDEVVLASGDGIFADAVATLGIHGVSVTVVAHRSSLAKKLQMAASRTLTFSNSKNNTEGAA